MRRSRTEPACHCDQPTTKDLHNGNTDPEAVIGYNRPLQTFFLQAFPDEEQEDLALWIGMEFRAYEMLTDLQAAAMKQGYGFMPLSPETLHSLAEDYAREAMRMVPDAIFSEFRNPGRSTD